MAASGQTRRWPRKACETPCHMGTGRKKVLGGPTLKRLPGRSLPLLRVQDSDEKSAEKRVQQMLGKVWSHPGPGLGAEGDSPRPPLGACSGSGGLDLGY